MDFTQRLVLIAARLTPGNEEERLHDPELPLPQRGVMSMHCSANVSDGRCAIFFDSRDR